MIKKIGLGLFLVVVALVGLGCSNVLEVEKTGEKSRLIVSLGQMGRLVSPETLNNNGITSFVLSGTKADATDFETIKEWTSKEGSSAYDLMTSDEEILVDSGSWTFQLEAKKGESLVASASKPVDVQAGTTTILDFGTMSHITTGNGTVSISLSWPQEEKVTRVVAGLYHRDDNSTLEGTEKTFQEETIRSSISYTATDIPAGSYRFKAQVYQGDTVIATYTELVQVAGNLASSASRELQNLNTLYTVTFDANNGTGTMNPQTFTAGVEQELAANTTFTREDYIFIGWSENSEATSATYIDKAKFTANKDTTLYAVWSDKILTFTSGNETHLKVTYYGSIEVPTGMEYSTDGKTWTAFTKEQPNISFGNGTKLYLRGKSPTGTATSTTEYVDFTFKDGTKVSASGDIRTLVDWNDPINADTSNARFSKLFWSCDELVTAPELPAETLAERCYWNMFYGCTGLTTAPELPATELAVECYWNMFSSCTSLKTAPTELPATKLADSCYFRMFYGCTSLKTAPELPAPDLAESCYSYMFYGCESLTKAPALPATNLATDCYSSMFRGCTSLKTAPELKAETLAESCYSYMFYGCTGLETAPELPAMTLYNHCYEYMFYGCKGLKTAPELKAETLAGNCYSSMFSGCTGLTTAPALPATNLAVECYSSMFYGCTGLTTAPELKAETLAGGCYISMFSGCTSLETAPALLAKKLATSCYSFMFSGCTSLKTAPALPVTKLAESCYYSMFEGCESLTTAPALPATNLAVECYSSMFYGCTGLTTAPELPATNLAKSCYSSMFRGCTGLTTAPELPAKQLANFCYKNMFNGCENLASVTMLATDVSAVDALDGWLWGTAENGTLTVASGMEDNIKIKNSLPSGKNWTVVEQSN